jgi:hypothetical protein
MASLILKMSVSLDGHVASLDGSTGWLAASGPLASTPAASAWLMLIRWRLIGSALRWRGRVALVRAVGDADIRVRSGYVAAF